MIPQSNISRLSNRLAKLGGRRIPEAVLERDYCIAWFLIGLSQASLRKKLAFKGGTSLKRCQFADYRFSEDMDFTLLLPLTFEELKTELIQIFTKVSQAAGIRINYLRDDPDKHQNCYTFYLGYEGPLPVLSSGREVKVDVTIKECLVFPIEEKAVIKSYSEYSDIPEGKNILCYSLNEIASEKTVALLDRARSEPRDLYDLWYLITNENISITELRDAVEQKLKFRNKSCEQVRGEFEKKEPRLKKTWETRLATQMAELPEFEQVYRAVKRELRRADFS